LRENLHVLKVKGHRVGLEKLVADHAREVEAERVLPRKRPVINPLDVFFLYVSEGKYSRRIGARKVKMMKKELRKGCLMLEV